MAVSPVTVTGSDAILKDTMEPQKIQQISSMTTCTASTHSSVDWGDVDVQSVDLETEESGSTGRRLSYSSGSSGSSGSSVITIPSAYQSTTPGSTGNCTPSDDMDTVSSFKQKAAFSLEIYGM